MPNSGKYSGCNIQGDIQGAMFRVEYSGCSIYGEIPRVEYLGAIFRMEYLRCNIQSAKLSMLYSGYNTQVAIFKVKSQSL